MRAILLAIASAFLLFFTIIPMARERQRHNAILAEKEAEEIALVTAKAFAENTDLPEGIPSAKRWIGDERKAVEQISVNNLQITGMVTSTIYRGDTLLSQFRWYNSVDKNRGWPRYSRMCLFTTDTTMFRPVTELKGRYIIASGLMYYDPVYCINPWSKIVVHLMDLSPDIDFEREVKNNYNKWANH